MPVQNEVEIEHAISAFAAEPDGGLLLTGGLPNPARQALRTSRCITTCH
jgi:hypothetical protein